MSNTIVPTLRSPQRHPDGVRFLMFAMPAGRSIWHGGIRKLGSFVVGSRRAAG